MVAGFLSVASSSFAQPLLPPLINFQLDSWGFNDTNWFSDLGYAPANFANLDNPTSWDGNALQVDNTNFAGIQLNVVENDGTTNLTLGKGTVEFWFMPNWNSGTGPGDWGRLIEVGTYTPDASQDWWSLYFNPDGTSISFSSQTNGMATNYFSCPISWDTNTWHFIVLAYSRFSTQLYLDGQRATNGAGMIYLPGHDALTNGFFIGSDNAGFAQARGQFENLVTYNYPLGEYGVTNDYATGLQLMNPLVRGGFSPSSPFDLGGGESGGGGDSPYYGMTPADYGTNLWLAISSLVSNTAPLMLSNTQPAILYEIQGKTNLLQSDWISMEFVNGSELTNWTPASVVASQEGNLFLRIRSWADNTGTGIPDWWWFLYFNQTTNADASASAAGDGYNNLYKFQHGLNPTNYYNPNAPDGFFGCLDATGTNFVLEWSPASGPVVSYVIQRGVNNTNTGNYDYTEISTTSSNITFFTDVGANNSDIARYYTIYKLAAIYPDGSLSATNTWYAWWVTSAAPYGAPTVSNIFAYAAATGTNVLLSWSSTSGLATNSIVVRGVFDSTNYVYNYSQIAQVGTNTTSYEITNAIANTNNWGDLYGVVSVYPGNGWSQPATSPINTGSTGGPAAPGNFFGYLDATGTNIYLTWNPVSGAVTNYIVFGRRWIAGSYRYLRLGTVSAGTTSFQVLGAINSNGYDVYNLYSVVAAYSDGSLSQSANWDPYYGAPAPAAFYANVDATGTNILLTWSPVSGATGYRVWRITYGYYYNQIAQVGTNTTSYLDVNGVNSSYDGIETISYEVRATYPDSGLSPAVTALVSSTPTAPNNLSATVDSTGTNVTLSWNPALGTVSGYIVERGDYNPGTGLYNYSQIGTVGSNTTSYVDVGARRRNSFFCKFITC